MDEEDKTRIIRRPGQPAGGGNDINEDDPTRIVRRADDEEFAEDMAETRKLDPVDVEVELETDPTPVMPESQQQQSSFIAPSPPPTIEEDDKTVIYRPNQPAIQPDAATGVVPPAENPQEATDPVVGWLVIIGGPGRGNHFALGYGNNSVGRGIDQRVTIDFGDNEISRENHLTITYDHRGRKFYANGGGSNQIAYVGESPLLQPVELKGGEDFTIGQTKLAFVPFCSDSFDWREA